jgi:site-specific DNA-adenine methylase
MLAIIRITHFGGDRMPKVLALTKYVGAKSYQLKELNKHFALAKAAGCSTFIDVFAGAGSVTLNNSVFKPEACIVNDLDVEMYDLWTSFNNIDAYADLKRELYKLTYNEATFIAHKNRTDPIATVVKHRFSRNAEGKAFSWSERLRGGQPESLNAWENYLGSLNAVFAKVRNIPHIYSLDFRVMLGIFDDQKYVLYLDPPYYPGTRTAGLYRCEMTVEDHAALIKLCKKSKARIILSGRPNGLYDAELTANAGWQRFERTIVNQMSGKSKTRKPEVIWRNF